MWRERVAAQLSFSVPEHGELSLPQLALKAKSLAKILTFTETASLAGLPATLPFRVRDQGRQMAASARRLEKRRPPISPSRLASNGR